MSKIKRKEKEISKSTLIRKKSEKKNYNISEIDFISVFCLDGNVNLLFVSLSNVIVVALLVNDDNVR